MEQIVKLKKRSKKRLGRGYGSGKGGHTVGRGQKGQNARGSLDKMFSGMKTKKSLIKKIPLRRGKGKFSSLKSHPLPVDLSLLEFFSKGDVVTIETLVEKGIISPKEVFARVKILGKGELTKALTVAVPCSHQAQKAIEAAGGSLDVKGKTELETSKRKKTGAKV